MSFGVISKKKTVWMHDLCSFRPKSDTKCAAEQVLTFFFLEIISVSFLIKTPSIPSRNKPTSQFERPAFVLKIIE